MFREYFWLVGRFDEGEMGNVNEEKKKIATYD